MDFFSKLGVICQVYVLCFLREARKEVNELDSRQRQEQIWQILCIRRKDTAENLAIEFKVSVWTIYRDFDILRLVHPIDAVRGRHGGGFKIADWYHPTSRILSPVQIALLLKILPNLPPDEKIILHTILEQFAS